MRHEQTQGLMQARTTGADAARGDAIALLDCHVKPDPKWHVSVLRELNENCGLSLSCAGRSEEVDPLTIFLALFCSVLLCSALLIWGYCQGGGV